MAQAPTSMATRLTLNGVQSMLQGIFNEAIGYGDIRSGILSHLDNDDFTALRLTTSTINACLLTPIAQPRLAGTHAQLRYQRDLLDKCDETITSYGACPNPPRCNHINKHCDYASYPHSRQRNPHLFNHNGTTPRICQGCRDNHDYYTSPAAISHISFHTSGHTAWRTMCAQATIPVCKRCDREQRDAVGPDGFDACSCYRRFHAQRWYCVSCDEDLLANAHLRARQLQARFALVHSSLVQVGNRMQTRAVAPPRWSNVKPDCPCGRMRGLAHALPAISGGPAPQIRFAGSVSGNAAFGGDVSA